MSDHISLPLKHDDARSVRLRAALRSGSALDVAPLLRQVLATADIAEPKCDVTDIAGLEAAAGRAGLVTTRFGMNGVRVSLQSLPDLPWLEGDLRWLDLAIAAPGRPTIGGETIETMSREHRPVSADPAYERATGFGDHVVAAQRRAARAVALAPPGSVTHVLLPTGSGKSNVGLLPALAHDGQVVMVVPTTAIALDQERSLQARRPDLPRTLAWHGDLDGAARSEVKDRLLLGTQQIVITSPEALATSLEVPVRRSAEAGKIHTVVVDEAHLIHDWGLEFRPELQQVASIWDQLVEAAVGSQTPPPRAVLQTATLVDDALQLNDQLFPGRGQLRLVGAAALRTEPRFLRCASASTADSRNRLVDLLRVVPRPAIIYATRKRVVREVFERLRAEGFQRVAAFDGDTETSARRDILRRWQGLDGPTEIDVVVATAAFGLGVDQSDVRTVIHAETPASVGSFYQEVGRGGRDGHAAVSILMHSPGDRLSAPRVADAKLIGDDKAIPRWQTMKATMVNGAVDITAVPPHLDDRNDKNALWNKNTLGLMQRAGLLRIVPVALPDRGADEEAWSEWTRRRSIEVLVDDLDEQAIRDGLSMARQQVVESRRRDLEGVHDLVDGNRCFGTIFSDVYTLSDPVNPGRSIRPVPACSGCPGCGRSALRAIQPALPELRPPTDMAWPSALEHLAVGPYLIVHAEAKWLERQSRALLERLVGAGIRHVYSSSLGRRERQWLGQAAAPYVAVDPELNQTDMMDAFERPSLVWLPSEILASLRRAPGAPRVIVTESGCRAPDKPTETLAEWWRSAITAERLMEEL
ncbi:MAG: protein DpdF [Dehalococcoidia bacterium]